MGFRFNEAVDIKNKIRLYLENTIKNDLGERDILYLEANETADQIKNHVNHLNKKCEILSTAYDVIEESHVIILFWDTQKEYGKEYNLIRNALKREKTVINLYNGEPLLLTLQDVRNLKDIFTVSGTAEDPDPYNHLLSDFDREIYESADFGFCNGQVLRVHEVLDEKPYYYKINFIRLKIGCTGTEAQKLSGLFEYLNIPEKTVLDSLNFIKNNNTLERAFKNLGKLADDLKEKEKEDSTQEDEEEFTGKDDFNDNYFDESGRFNQFRYEIEKMFPVEIDTEDLTVGTEEEITSIYENGFTTHAFHVENIFSKIPIGFSLTPFEKGYYSNKPCVLKFIDEIKEAADKEKIATVGVKLFKVQKGEIRLKNTPDKNEWTYIWHTYKVKKFSLTKGVTTLPFIKE